MCAGAPKRGSAGAWERGSWEKERQHHVWKYSTLLLQGHTRLSLMHSSSQRAVAKTTRSVACAALSASWIMRTNATRKHWQSAWYLIHVSGVQAKRSSEEVLMMLRVPSITHDANYNQMTQQFAVRKLAICCMEAGTMIGSIPDFFSLLYQIKFQTPKAEWMVEGGMGVRKCRQKLECDICSCCYWSKTPENAMHNVKSTGIIMYCWPTQCLYLYNGHWLQWLTLSPQIIAGINGIKI